MIPKIFHQIWLQGLEQIPEHLQKLRNECMSLYGSQFQFKLWDAPQIEKLLGEFDPELLSLYRSQAKSHAQRSDIARYVIVYLYGGIYIDTDYRCLKDVSTLLGDGIDLFYVPFQDVAGVRVMNGIFGAAPKHKLLDITIRTMKQRLGGSRRSTTSTTGTLLFMDCIKEYHRVHPKDTRYVVVSNLQLFPCTVWDDTEKCNARWQHTAFMTHQNEGSWHPVLFGIAKKFVQYRSIIIPVLVSLAVLLVVLLAQRRCKKACKLACPYVRRS